MVTSHAADDGLPKKPTSSTRRLLNVVSIDFSFRGLIAIEQHAAIGKVQLRHPKSIKMRSFKSLGCGAECNSQVVVSHRCNHLVEMHLLWVILVGFLHFYAA